VDFEGNTIIQPAPFVEVELVYEQGRPGLSGSGYCALQLWTQNTIYDVDWSMRCFRVVSKANGQPVPNHPFLGARLTGGQNKNPQEALELSYPVPRPGAVAVFELPGRYVTTSEVNRIILRVRVISVTDEAQANPLWDTLSKDDG
jgi:hypothetical protein